MGRQYSRFPHYNLSSATILLNLTIYICAAQSHFPFLFFFRTIDLTALFS
jgi:hypothetical protein